MNVSDSGFFDIDAALYLVDADTLRCEYANVAAQRGLQYSMAELCELGPGDGGPGFSAEKFFPLLAPLRTGERQEMKGKTRFRRKDGTVFPVAVRLYLWRGSGKSFLIIVANDISMPAEQAEQREGEEEKLSQMGEGALSHTIVSNPPGMVFQYVQGKDGRYRMPFVSDQCVNVLGITTETLQANPGLLTDLVLAEDRESLRRSRAQSAARLTPWNWEGRLWIESYHDVKWISLRANPRWEKNIGVIWDGIMINITQSRRRETALLESHERLREVSSHVMAAREHERIRIAREIHDDLGGNLTAIKIDLDWLARHIDGDGAGRDDAGADGNAMLLAKIRTIDQVVDRTIDSIRRMSRDLRPGIMDFGIVAAIEWEAGEFSKRLGIPCEVACAQQDIDLEQDVAVAVFRIFLEALTNITKHARASRVSVCLEEAEGQLELEIWDDGCGITPEDTAKRDSFGVRGMVERAGLLDGKLTISGKQKEDGGETGTTVHLSIPLARGAGGPPAAQSDTQP